MRVGIGQINPTIGDFTGNLERIVRMVEAARRAGCHVVVFPELCITGYPPNDLLLKRAFVQASVDAVERLKPYSRDIAIVVGHVEPNPGEGRPLFNAATVLYGGDVFFRTYKSLLPTYDVFDEDRYFEPNPDPQVFDFQGWRVGLSICEDFWNDKDFWKTHRLYPGREPRLNYHLDPVEVQVRKGANVLMNISSSPYVLGKVALREEMLRSLARKYGVPVVYVNLVGANDELIFDGSSRVFDAQGRCVYRAPSFEEHLGVVDLTAPTPLTAEPPTEGMAYLYQALVLGIRDYLRKCGFRDVLVGVSGGIDSAVVATLAADALGPDHVIGVFMPSRFTSPESVEDATTLARNLGIRWHVIPIDDIFEAFLARLHRVYEPPGGVAEENLQARIRGTLLMTLSNRWGALVLSTGNKSELALGYCTLYGDMTGGLAVLGDVPKMMVYELARFLNREKERIPARIFTKPPSAELRPGQRDEDDIPPYRIVDQIIRLYVEEEMSVPEIVAQGFDPETVRQVVLRIDRNEYKRRQAPPVLKVTSRAFGSGRRMPIAQRFRHETPAS